LLPYVDLWNLTGVDDQGRITEPDNFAAMISSVKVGRYPFGVTLSPDDRTLFVTIQYAQGANAIWLALTKDIDFSRPDADEVKLREAIMKSEGLPRQKAVQQK
jgi:hypothetical protein